MHADGDKKLLTGPILQFILICSAVLLALRALIGPVRISFPIYSPLNLESFFAQGCRLRESLCWPGILNS